AFGGAGGAGGAGVGTNGALGGSGGNGGDTSGGAIDNTSSVILYTASFTSNSAIGGAGGAGGAGAGNSGILVPITIPVPGVVGPHIVQGSGGVGGDGGDASGGAIDNTGTLSILTNSCFVGYGNTVSFTSNLAAGGSGGNGGAGGNGVDTSDVDVVV